MLICLGLGIRPHLRLELEWKSIRSYVKLIAISKLKKSTYFGDAHSTALGTIQNFTNAPWRGPLQVEGFKPQIMAHKIHVAELILKRVKPWFFPSDKHWGAAGCQQNQYQWPDYVWTGRLSNRNIIENWCQRARHTYWYCDWRSELPFSAGKKKWRKQTRRLYAKSIELVSQDWFDILMVKSLCDRCRKPVIRARKCDLLKDWIHQNTDVFNENYRKAVRTIRSDNKEYHASGTAHKNSLILAEQLPCYRLG